MLKDRYRAQKLLGRGGFGRTFQAIDENRPGHPLCVIKQFAHQSLDPSIQQAAIKLFREEVQHLETLGNHPQIPNLLSSFDLYGQPCLVQEFIDGQDLEKELAMEGVFDQQKVRDLLLSLLPVLNFLHSQATPIIHRDIKPANIIRRSMNGSLILVDFGAAKQATQTLLAKTGTIIGSAEYSSPEQARGKPTFASDVFSLGVTCINLLTGVSPFELFSTVEDDWVWRDYLVRNPVDESLGNVLDKMIMRAQSRRYRSAPEVIEQLNSLKPLIFHPTMTASTTPPYRNFQGILSDRWKSFLTAQVEKNQPTASNSKIFNWLGQWKKTDLIQVVYFPCEVEFFQEKDLELDMVYIPACSFYMGCAAEEQFSNPVVVHEKPQHWVSVSSFYLGQNPITEAQYALIMDKPLTTDPKLPATLISWYDTQVFCDRLSAKTGKKYRLPSESEWEGACRANTTTPYYFGEVVDSALANFYFDEFISPPALAPIDSNYPLNSFGLKDMHGNIWEWCQDDWHDDSEGAPRNGHTGHNEQSANLKVIRGGSRHNPPALGRSSCRDQSLQNHLSPLIGFRVACDQSDSGEQLG